MIAGITPYFLERGVLWFTENQSAIQAHARRDPWWRTHTLFVEPGVSIPLSRFLRDIADLGYSRTSHVMSPGEFGSRGGIVDVFPVNRARPLRIEFSGNTIETISELDIIAPEKRKRSLLPDSPSEYERLWLSDLGSDDFLVHVDHGIGIFRGFTSGERGEYYELEYAPARKGGVPDRLLVPREQSKKISRYIGFETPAIHRLGGTIWESTKRRAREDARKLAEELLVLYRERARSQRDPYPAHAEIMTELAASFPYPLTPDQERAMIEIDADLSAVRPMDRLLLGDVGFGKTEVAIRAAARVAYSGRQVAVIAPTTILADQHLATFRDRLSGLPIEIAGLSRLTGKRAAKHIVSGIADGKIDIAIGTHRLLSKDIRWKRLGLAVVDEEQRFGVRHKETLKQLRAELDVLALSATPIPRTLSLALAKFRALSLIRTPPPGRAPIKTFILPFSNSTIREAIALERKRKGQMFFLWNRIETIESVRRDIALLAPKARSAVLHGRMTETSLIRTMHDFREGHIDILVATTIIENGLDLPSVNTLVVADASRLGLAQSYQLRGRVGRGRDQAYAYFLYRPRAMTEKAKLRLEALAEANTIGAGFQVALRDLEIRGAGNVLGKQQSGAMNRVGLNLYAQLLSEALEELGDE